MRRLGRQKYHNYDRLLLHITQMSIFYLQFNVINVFFVKDGNHFIFIRLLAAGAKILKC